MKPIAFLNFPLCCQDKHLLNIYTLKIKYIFIYIFINTNIICTYLQSSVKETETDKKENNKINKLFCCYQQSGKKLELIFSG